jgi:hypothetical protein
VSSFDLRALIRDELETSAIADPHVVAEHVAKRVPDADLRAALEKALVPIVREMATVERGDVIQKIGRRQGTPWHETASPLYQKLLQQRIEVGGDEREWKFLGDCTRGDLLHAVEFRREQARANMVAAQRYQALVDVMDEKSVERVADLPLPTIAAVFS